MHWNPSALLPLTLMAAVPAVHAEVRIFVTVEQAQKKIFSGAPLKQTPVVLAETVAALGQVDVLVNLGDAVPVGFETVPRLIEIVTADDLDRANARMRWKQYSQQGYELIRHDLAKPVAA